MNDAFNHYGIIVDIQRFRRKFILSLVLFSVLILVCAILLKHMFLFIIAILIFIYASYKSRVYSSYIRFLEKIDIDDYIIISVDKGLKICKFYDRRYTSVKVLSFFNFGNLSARIDDSPYNPDYLYKIYTNSIVCRKNISKEVFIITKSGKVEMIIIDADSYNLLITQDNKEIKIVRNN